MLRYIFTSLIRNGYRSLIPVVICTAITVLLCLYGRTMDENQTALDETYRNTRLEAYVARRNDLRGARISKELAEKIGNTEHIETAKYLLCDIHFEWDSLPYSEEEGEGDKTAEIPPVTKTYLNINNIEVPPEKEAELIATGIERDQIKANYFSIWLSEVYPEIPVLQCSNTLSAFERFSFESKNDAVFLLDEYKDTFFTSEEYLVIASMQLFNDLKIAYGDYILLHCYEPISKYDWQFGRTNVEVASIPVKVVGSYSGEGKLYGNLALGYKVFEATGMPIEFQTAKYVLKNVDTLEEFKQQILDLGFVSSKQLSNDDDIALVIDDKKFTESVDTLTSNLSLQRALYPVLILVCLGIGMLCAWLLTRSRRGEYAIMRSIGASRRMVIATALTEQVVLALVGVSLGWLLFSRTQASGVMAYASIGLVFGCYCLGSGLSVFLCTRINVMAIMKEKE